MSNQILSGDPSVNQDLILRRNRNATIVFRFVDQAGDDYPITHDFELNAKISRNSTENVIHLTASSGISVDGNEITATFTEANTNIKKEILYWELKDITTGQNWYTGDLHIINGQRPDSESEVTNTINIGDHVLQSTIILSASVSDQVPLEDFTSELVFDGFKDLETVSGGTITFTLADDGHLNGVGITARINSPVAVNFPSEFERISGSDNISTTAMNLILFRYFRNYDGDGNDKVLYIIKNQAAL